MRKVMLTENMLKRIILEVMAEMSHEDDPADREYAAAREYLDDDSFDELGHDEFDFDDKHDDHRQRAADDHKQRAERRNAPHRGRRSSRFER